MENNGDCLTENIDFFRLCSTEEDSLITQQGQREVNKTFARKIPEFFEHEVNTKKKTQRNDRQHRADQCDVNKN